MNLIADFVSAREANRQLTDDYPQFFFVDFG